MEQYISDGVAILLVVMLCILLIVGILEEE